MKSIPAVSALRARPIFVIAMAIVVAAMFNAFLVGCGGNAGQSSSGETPAATDTPATTGSSGTTDGGGMAAAVDGAKIYADRCALCHGATGHGDGPASAGLDPKPRNHTDGTYMNERTDQELLMVIRGGKGAMPAWKDVLTEEEIEATLKHVRSLARPPYHS